jgi:hypothetical protein
MQGKKLFIFPAIFIAVLLPVAVAALLIYTPGEDADECGPTTLDLPPHSHGYGLVSTMKNDMQLIMNVSDAAELYQLNDEGRLELCGGDLTGEAKHITVDVNDARLALGERLPVTVTLTVRDQATGAVYIDARDAPAMYAPGHGYHFGDNYLVPNGATYDWTVTVSPVQALRQDGAQNLWSEPVTWAGSFTLDDAGNVTGKASGVQTIGDFIGQGLHVTLSYEPDAVPLYEADGATVATGDASHYFVVDVTDHAVNYEEKLPGAEVTLTFAQGDESFEARAQPVISPDYGFHYGANVALPPGEWTITVHVAGLSFMRHAGSALGVGRAAISEDFTFTVE